MPLEKAAPPTPRPPPCRHAVGLGPRQVAVLLWSPSVHSWLCTPLPALCCGEGYVAGVTSLVSCSTHSCWSPRGLLPSFSPFAEVYCSHRLLGVCFAAGERGAPVCLRLGGGASPVSPSPCCGSHGCLHLQQISS